MVCKKQKRSVKQYKRSVKQYKRSVKQYKRRKAEAYNIIKKLYHFMLHNPDNICLKKLHGNTMGYYDHDTEEITLDYRKDIIPTLIHEFIHHLHPSWSETKVFLKERSTVAILSTRQYKNIIRVLANCL